MTNIYDTHAKAFKGTAAYVLLKEGELFARIAFSYSSKTGNVRCFFHQPGWKMQLGTAGGGGYDKESAAFEAATAKHLDNFPDSDDAKAIHAAARRGNGSSHWFNEFRDTEFKLIQAV